jgi:hypothetical protein
LKESSVFQSLTERDPNLSVTSPGPGHYSTTSSNGFFRSSRVTFGSYSRRETDEFMRRDPRSPFKNQTNYSLKPAPGSYMKKDLGKKFRKSNSPKHSQLFDHKK